MAKIRGVLRIFLKSTNRAWIGSVQGAVATWSNHGSQESLGVSHAITDQVATAPCTDPIQEMILDF